MAEIIFATAINCIDGRTHIPVIEYLRDRFGVDYVDLVTESGPNKILAENSDKTSVNSIKKRVAISIERHASELIAIIGHHECAVTPQPKTFRNSKLSLP